MGITDKTGDCQSFYYVVSLFDFCKCYKIVIKSLIFESRMKHVQFIIAYKVADEVIRGGHNGNIKGYKY